MNYRKHYDKLIERSKNRTLTCYKEVHHIVPKCMGGKNNKENLVSLTAREHFIAHILLVKIYPNEYGLIRAVNMMCMFSEQQDRSMNRMYGWLREKFIIEMSRSQRGENNNQYGTMWVYNDTLKISKKVPKDYILEEGWVKGRKINFNTEKYCLMCDKIHTKTTSDFCNRQCAINFKKKKGEYINPMKGKKMTFKQKEKMYGHTRNNGSNNPSAKLINVYNKEGVVMYMCDGNFNKTLKENNMPVNAFIRSYSQNIKLGNTNQSKSSLISRGYGEYIGWYAIIV